MNAKEGLVEGKSRKNRGIQRVTAKFPRETAEFRYRFLWFLLLHPTGEASADEMEDAEERLTTFGPDESNGNWRGGAIGGLGAMGLIESVGHQHNSRPSSHALNVNVWRITDVEKAKAFLRELLLKYPSFRKTATVTVPTTHCGGYETTDYDQFQPFPYPV